MIKFRGEKEVTPSLQKSRSRQTESGNVLFLILIAVALFAALSYAVTQSTRSGGGSDNETGLINSAQITQYPASIRTSVVRMIIGGVDVTSIQFNAPSDFGNLTDPTFGVFNPSGGSATFSVAPQEMIAAGNTSFFAANGLSKGEWVFNSENQIDLIGTTDTGGPTTSTADIIAFLPGITLSLCNRLNDELDLPTPPPAEAGINYSTQMNGDGTSAPDIGAGGGSIGDAANTAANAPLDGHPFGCFQDSGATTRYVYYHVLVER
jgi:hypothetical protein